MISLIIPTCKIIDGSYFCLMYTMKTASLNFSSQYLRQTYSKAKTIEACWCDLRNTNQNLSNDVLLVVWSKYFSFWQKAWVEWANFFTTFSNIDPMQLWRLFYSATTRTGPLGTKLTNHKVNWEQWKATFLVNGPMMFKNTNNSYTTKFENSTTLQKGADLSGHLPLFWLFWCAFLQRCRIFKFCCKTIVCILTGHWSVNQKGRFPLFSICLHSNKPH